VGGNKRGSYQRRRKKVTDCFIVEVTEKKIPSGKGRALVCVLGERRAREGEIKERDLWEIMGSNLRCVDHKCAYVFFLFFFIFLFLF
jgi:hypothetical protein